MIENMENITIAIRLKKFRLELISDVEDKEALEKQINNLNKVKKALVKQDESILSKLIDAFMMLEIKLFMKNSMEKKVIFRNKEKFYYKIHLDDIRELEKNNISFISHNYLFIDITDEGCIENYKKIFLNDSGYTEIIILKMPKLLLLF